jgi:hypothetical protein
MSSSWLSGRLPFNRSICRDSSLYRGDRLTGRYKRSWMLLDFLGLKLIRFVP